MVADPASTVKLDGILDPAEVLRRIGQFADAHPEVTWIEGGGWDDAAFLQTGPPNRHMLDSVVPDRPVYLYNNSGHATWSNTVALEIANITAETPDPPNGQIARDAEGEPTGLLHEDSAMALMEAVMPPWTHEDHVRNLSAALDEMSRLGITALEDAMATAEIAAAFKTLDDRGELMQRSELCLPFDPLEDDEEQINWFLSQRAELASDRLGASCVKLFVDGAYGSHTVVLLEPYSDDPSYGRGELFIERERLMRLVTRLDAEGFQVHAHAQGDGAVRATLDAFEEARRRNGFQDNRHTIAHLVLIDPDDYSRFRELGVIANFTPLWSLGDAWETVFAPRLFGPERSQHIFKTRTLLDAGVMLVWGSDWDVTGVSPLDGLETATTHRYPGGIDLEGNEDSVWNPTERVSLEQAIVAYTSAGAYLMHDDTRRGTLAAGMLADMVVLDRNLFESAPLEIHKTQVDMTIVGGVVVFSRVSD
jgi:predicted amidohydrolase YtcJ